MSETRDLNQITAQQMLELAETVKITLPHAPQSQAENFQKLIAALDVLKNVELESFPPDFGQNLWAAATREDQTHAPFDPQKLTATSPSAQPPYFVVPRVL